MNKTKYNKNNTKKNIHWKGNRKIGQTKSLFSKKKKK